MADQPERPRFIERRDSSEATNGGRATRSKGMLAAGGIALILGLIGTVSAGSAVALIVAILGIALIVGGLVIRP